MEHYHTHGFSGAIRSIDVTHVKWDRCPYSLQRSYTDKVGFPTIVYQATVDFTGQLLGTTRGFAGAQNDKTIIRSDIAVQKVREDCRYTEQTFQLKRADGTAVQHKGNYLIADNGYHKVGPVKTHALSEIPILDRSVVSSDSCSSHASIGGKRRHLLEDTL